jgi:uncharacterized protein YwgA
MLSLVLAAGGTYESRIRLQKSAYLLKAAGSTDFLGASFKYHHYGPYSRSLSDALQDAVGAGLLAELRQEFGEEQSKYTYEISPAGRQWLQENAEDDGESQVEKFAPLLKSAPWRVLELAATVLFVEQDECTEDRAIALDRAIQLKPACAEHRAAAQELLVQLGL